MNEILWAASEAATATGGKLVGSPQWKATGIAMDSRLVHQGDLFIALKGVNDGHDYVAQAFAAGAVAAIVEHPVEGLPHDAPLLVVKDSFDALRELGQAARYRGQMTHSIAITGSVGKTGTRAMLEESFGAQFKTHASTRSYNNHLGVPFTLAGTPASAEVGIFEIGMNHAGEITPLAKQVAPDIAIITTVAPVHIENFDDGIDGIIRAKSEIFDGMNANGTVILPRDNDHFSKLTANAKTAGVQNILTFGEHEKSDARLVDCLLASNGTRVKAEIMGEEIAYTLLIAGKHIAINSLAALLAVKIAGGDIHKAAHAMERMEPLEGRGKRETIDSGDVANPITLIDESYNASPVAMKAAFRVLAMIDPGRGGRRIAVLGDMLELGKQSRDMHESLAMPLQAAGVDLLYTCGQNMKSLYDAMPPANQGAHRDTSAELAEIVPDALMPGDVVLVKGSLGSKMKTVVEAMRAIPERRRASNA